MNTIGEMKDIYVIASHVGIAGERIDRFLRTAELAGYVLMRKEPPQNDIAKQIEDGAPGDSQANR